MNFSILPISPIPHMRIQRRTRFRKNYLISNHLVEKIPMSQFSWRSLISIPLSLFPYFDWMFHNLDKAGLSGSLIYATQYIIKWICFLVCNFQNSLTRFPIPMAAFLTTRDWCTVFSVIHCWDNILFLSPHPPQTVDHCSISLHIPTAPK